MARRAIAITSLWLALSWCFVGQRPMARGQALRHTRHGAVVTQMVEPVIDFAGNGIFGSSVEISKQAFPI